MKYINDIVLEGSDASTNAQSSAIFSALLLYVSAQVVSTGSPTATIKFQASNDKGNPQNGFVPTNWVDIPSATVTLSASGVVLIPKTEIAYNWIRIAQVAGGTGTIKVNVFGIGA